MARKITIDIVSKSLRSEGYKLLSDTYINSKSKLEVECPLGHRYKTTWFNWYTNGSRCPVCNGGIKYDLSYVKNYFRQENYTLLSDVYINSRQKLKYRCEKGHLGHTTFSGFVQGIRCKKCSVESSRKYNIAGIRDLFEKEGYVLLSKVYFNGEQKLKFVCPNGHTHEITLNSWLKGHRCSKCYGNNRLNFYDIKNIIESEGYILLSTDYQNAMSPIKLKCPVGHVFSTTWSNWKLGKRCKKCFMEKIQPTFNEVNKSVSSEDYVLLSTNYVNNKTKLEVECPNHHIFYIRWNDWKHGHRCYKCNSSLQELEVIDYVKSITNDVIERDRSILAPKELDIVIPSKKIDIEYCGLYWHSELAGKDKNYHLDKLEACIKKGYRLITIFEDEWLFKKDVVKSKLKNIINAEPFNRIFARKCVVSEIDTKTASIFCKSNHLQSYGKSLIKLGLFHNDMLVSAMTFSKPSIAKGSKQATGNEWELNRFCSEPNYLVVGGASKLLKYFERNYNCAHLFSYADRRWSNGNLYEKLGFNLVSNTQPNYWYIKDKKRIHRFSLRKKKEEPKNITEWQIRQSQGWNRIWDCGNLKYEKSILGGAEWQD